MSFSSGANEATSIEAQFDVGGVTGPAIYYDPSTITADSFWARAFYDSHRTRGSAHNAAVRALAFKWIRVLFRCWVDRTPYDESRYLSALQERQSPLLKFAAAQPS